VLPGSSPITPSSPPSKAHQKPGPFPPPALPGRSGTMTLSDPRPNRRLSRRRGRYPRPGGSPQLRAPPFRRAVPPPSADRNGCICRLLPRPTRPSPFLRRVGIRDVTFEACSGFTHVTPAGLLDRPRRPSSRGFGTASQPAKPLVSYQSKPTTLRVEPPSTGDTRPLGALRTKARSPQRWPGLLRSDGDVDGSRSTSSPSLLRAASRPESG